MMMRSVCCFSFKAKASLAVFSMLAAALLASSDKATHISYLVLLLAPAVGVGLGGGK